MKSILACLLAAVLIIQPAFAGIFSSSSHSTGPLSCNFSLDVVSTQALANRALWGTVLGIFPNVVRSLRGSAAQTLFVGYGKSNYLKDVGAHLVASAVRLEVSLEKLGELIIPFRVVIAPFEFRLDGGAPFRCLAWRIVYRKPGKGGIRAVIDVVIGTIMALCVRSCDHLMSELKRSQL